MLHTFFAVYLALHGADLAQTLQIVGSGQGYEVNPIMRPLVTHPTLFGITKMGATATVVFTLEKTSRRYPSRTFWLTVALTSLEAVVVVHNARELRKIR